ncbi:unnamed protein product [Rotaria sp. Silwood2]|nr:unnamed protein product [Rotaria sp. Silwood2]CAF2993734.1 unnamed protein product [Rotaria sp. Silwood2]CAF3343388.1 unnamed protein product [Rotaria sp. Silwood2]CAF3352997.1 unnamed protein product [Rotaria sp. Silwood2]CAF4220462.1 unnamed protein product [Rotaria sp. Silwood2]
MPERNRLDEIQRKLDEFIDKMNTLAQINSNNTFLLNMPETIRRLRESQEQLRKQQESWKRDYEEKETKRIHETKREFELLRQQIENYTIDKRQIEQLIQASAIIKDLRESISRMRQLYDAIPVGLTQATLKSAITTSEKEAMKRESLIEQLTRNVDEHVKKLESRLNDLSTKPISSTKTISRAEVEKLIRDAIESIKPIEQNDNSELRKLIRDMNDRLAKLEKQFDQLSQSTDINHNHIDRKELDGQTIIKNQPTSQKAPLGKPVHQEEKRKLQSELPSSPFTQVQDILSIEQRLIQLENRFNASRNNEMKPGDAIRNIPLVGNAVQTQSIASTSNFQHPGSVEKLNVNKKNLPAEKSNQTTVPQSNNAVEGTLRDQKNISTDGIDQVLHDNYVPDLQERLNNYLVTIQNLQSQIDNLNKIKPDRQAVDDLVKASEQRSGQQISDLRKHANKYEDELSKVNADLAALRRQLTQKPTSTSIPSRNKSPPARTYSEEEFQAIMPFIEPLPIFAMLLENEWDEIY